MKANELMVGDWIYAIDDNGEKHPCRANNLEYDYINKRDGFCVDFYGTGYNPELPDVAFNVEPIPLTSEILEKNGFVKYDGGYKIFKSNDENYYFGFESIFFNEEINLLNVTKETCDGKQTSIKGYFNYVHELQHALKLCGIEKTIEL